MAKFDDKPKKKKRKKKVRKDAGGNLVDKSTGLTITPDDQEVIQESKAYKPAKKTVTIRKIPIEPNSERLIEKSKDGSIYLGDKVKRSGPKIPGSDKRELPKNYVTTSSDEGYNRISSESTDEYGFKDVRVSGGAGEGQDRESARAQHIRSEISKKLPQKDGESDLDYDKRIRGEANEFIRNDPSLRRTSAGAQKKGELSKQLEDEFRNVYESKANIYKSQDEKKDPNAEAIEAIEAEGEEATEEAIADWNSSKQKETLQEATEGQAIKSALEAEVQQNSTSSDELLQGNMIANEVAEEASREKKKKKEKEKEDNKKRSPLILKILEKNPGIAKDALMNMNMDDIFKIASKLGLPGGSSKKERRNAQTYLDTVQKLGVQDYFPQVGENLAVGTFTGARIGSQTVYSGAGGLAPMGLYDAKRRAMKAGLKSSTKAVENYKNFMNMPPQYNEDVQNILREEYESIMSDSDMSENERAQRLAKLENAPTQILSGWQSARNLLERSMNPKNEEKDQIYIPPSVTEKMYQMINGMYEPEFLKRIVAGDVNLAKLAGELKFYDDMIYSVRDLAGDFSSFEKTTPSEGFIEKLEPEELAEINQWKKGSEATDATKSIVKKYAKFFASDIDKTFNSMFKDEDGNLRENYSEDQEKQARQIFAEMLAPSFLEDVKTMSTGVNQSSMTAARRQEREYVFSNIRSKNDLKTFKETGASSTTKDEWAEKLSGSGSVRTNAGSFASQLGGNVLAVEKTAPNVEMYLLSNSIRRAGGGIKIRATVGYGGTDLLTANEIIRLIADGETVRAADLNGDVLTEDIMTRFIESSGGGSEGSTSAARYRLQAHSEAPTYYKNYVLHGIQDDSDVAEYNASEKKGMMWQDIAQPDYEYTSGNEVETLQFPFYVQGEPYEVDEAKMQEYDRLYQTTSSQTTYNNP